jgi:Ca2+-binding EF-hand superfamily protein
LFDVDKDCYLKKTEFQGGICRLFVSSFDENVKLVYDLFDFDSDGKISKEDIRTLLSHVPLVQILELTNSDSPHEGQFTKQGGGMYEIKLTKK